MSAIEAALPSYDTLRAFLAAHYKHERLEGRGEDYVDTVVRSRLQALADRGRDCISRHEAQTGVAILYDSALRVAPARQAA